jgi:polyisoprenoid-binding protein YceI
MMFIEMRGMALLAVVAAVAVPLPAGAQDRQTVTVASGGTVRLFGTSTLHPYSATAKEYRAAVGLKPTSGATPAADAWSLIASHGISSFELAIPVKALSSGEGGLDDNLRKALKADKNPTIEFRMTSYDVTAPSAPGGAAALNLKGELRVAGVDRTVEIDVDVKSVAGGLRITGSKVLSMTDFKVEPPVLMLGMIRTGNQVTIRFELELELELRLAGASAASDPTGPQILRRSPA